MRNDHAGQWCSLHDRCQDDPDHDYSAECEAHLFYPLEHLERSAALGIALNDLISAWEDGWDCSDDPGHGRMMDAVVKAKATRARLYQNDMVLPLIGKRPVLGKPDRWVVPGENYEAGFPSDEA